MEGGTRKLIKFSNYSLCVTLPKSITRELDWKKGDIVNLDIDPKGGSITVFKGEKSKETKAQSEKKKTKADLRW